MARNASRPRQAPAAGKAPAAERAPATGKAPFTRLRSSSLPALQLRIDEFRHEPTGALHLHISADHPESALLLALRTPPGDSTGVPHQLEHTLFCGSERYPVRDPFFYMLRRSLNTCMNAHTAADHTACYFASLHDGDFFNLLDIYLDAVFFPRLNPLDFAQEGHRLEFAEPDNPASPLVRRGVVYNEMKGVYSSPVARAWEAMKARLYPTSGYRYDSGGAPEQIPRLTHQALLNFHRDFYHPGNAIFMTFGRLAPETLQARFQARVLHRFAGGRPPVVMQPEVRYRTPQRWTLPCPAMKPGDGVQVLLGWLLGPGTEPEQLAEALLLHKLLLGTSASPLRRVLETTGLARAVSPLCGLETEQLELGLVVGVEGVEPARVDAVERLILDTLRELAASGGAREELDAAFHQLELAQRAVGSGTDPFGLQLMYELLPAVVHHGDPVARLDLAPALLRLRQTLPHPSGVRRLLQGLLDSPHRVRLVLQPSPGLQERREEAELAELQGLKARLTEAETRRLRRFSAALKARQQTRESLDCLPGLGRADIPDARPQATGARLPLASGEPCTGFSCGANGLVRVETLFSLPQLPPKLAARLPLLELLLGELGTAGKSWLDMQRELQAGTGGIRAAVQLRALPEDGGRVRGFLSVGGKSLAGNTRQLVRLLHEALTRADFRDTERIRKLVQQELAEREAALVADGGTLAVLAATSCLGPVPGFRHGDEGLPGLVALRRLHAGLAESTGMAELQTELRLLLERILTSARQHLLVAEAGQLEAGRALLDEYWGAAATGTAGGGEEKTSKFQPAPPAEPTQQLWVTRTEVNFCAQAYPTVPETHPDAAPLAILGELMTNTSLHGLIREQGGAYGASASQDLDNGCFVLSSYRDPEFAGTYMRFQQALDAARRRAPSRTEMEEALLGLAARMDAPVASPLGEAVADFHRQLHGRNETHCRAFRRALLAVTPDAVRKVAETYLRPERAHRGALIGEPRLAEVAGLGVRFRVRRC